MQVYKASYVERQTCCVNCSQGLVIGRSLRLSGADECIILIILLYFCTYHFCKTKHKRHHENSMFSTLPSSTAFERNPKSFLFGVACRLKILSYSFLGVIYRFDILLGLMFLIVKRCRLRLQHKQIVSPTPQSSRRPSLLY